MIYLVGDITLDSDFWDCSCEKDFIHNKEKFGLTCPKCGANEDEMPDSRVDEIKALYKADNTNSAKRKDLRGGELK